ncbi:MAG: PilX N-terminal domain-containing pilus assembly protein [Alloalcanivorax xenomutans]|jgi:type IV pilus assembly protein PilX
MMSITHYNSQRGAALLVALMILVIVSILGITAMKTSMFSSKIATGTQVDAMAFEGAESAVNEAFTSLYGMSSAQLQPFLTGSVGQRCLVGGEATAAVRACTSTDRMDSRGLVRAGSRIRQEGMRAVSGGQLSMSGNNTLVVDFTFEILGEAEIDDFSVNNHHMLEALKRGMVSSSDFNVDTEN